MSVGRISIPSPISRQEALDIIAPHDPLRVADTLTRLAIHDEDQLWVEGLCCAFAYHPAHEVRQAVIFCFQHYVYTYRRISVDRVIPVLQWLSTDLHPVVATLAIDALESIYLLIVQKDSPDE